MKRVALLFALSSACCTPAAAAPAKADVEKAAVRLAGVLDGVLRNCPTSFAKIGTTLKACVGTGGTVENVRMKLVAELEADLYGVWRSRDEQRSVFNWLKTPAGFVYVRLQPDPDGRAQTLVYVDTPPASAPAPTAAPTTPSTAAKPATPPANSTQIGGVTLTRPTPTPAPTTTPTPTPTPPARTPPPVPTPTVAAATPSPAPSATQPSVAPLTYTRPLELLPKRMNGQDVLAVQNRLIALTQPSGGGRGDGYFGPVTAATVRAFQAANGLGVTGRVDRATWDVLFSAGAKPFKASSIR
ncbi:peptidoglycan-binding domain-containing protein [Deinococcus puniceus]|uniref:Peptidoglycan-binding protein n=1 Tax=Deinococcus puniceus TaxID=1182568 RepID=A0A172T641_9DEIO|nr:peptidoglycan-binding domain-containing protein [Deinococcus puniceus]ANE42505.1 peptidoglycan-binding protein [Deinococcus puniceus]